MAISDVWKVCEELEILIQNKQWRNCTKLIALLPKDFSHRYYFEGICQGSQGDEILSFLSLHRAIELTNDGNLRDLYERQLLAGVWNSEFLGHHYFQNLMPEHAGKKKYNWPKIDPGSIQISIELLSQLQADFEMLGSNLLQPDNIWFQVNQTVNTKVLTTETFFPLNPIIGIEGMNRITVGKVVAYVGFVEEILPNYWDWLGILGSRQHVMATDFGSLMDCSLIIKLLRMEMFLHKKLSILEIGGGYGRLAEAIMSNVPVEVETYVLTDSLPISLASLQQYLLATVSNHQSVMVVPEWELDNHDFKPFDLIINIESFQEMSPSFQKFWIDYIETCSDSGSVAYLSNSYDYINPEPAELGSNWRSEFSRNTPRSWTPRHPTEIYVKK